MKLARELFDKSRHHFEGGKFSKFYPLYEATETFLFTPGTTTKALTHIRDALDIKRTMSMVVIALLPAIFMAMYNTGLQANSILASIPSANEVSSIHSAVYHFLGLTANPESFFANLIHGAIYFIPVWLVTFIAGGFWEVLFAIVRKHEINEGFLVTGMLFPLILPASIPLWQVAIGISFGVVIGKEVFGGTGCNIFNPALVGRAFLFFAYPAEISGDSVWYLVDASTGATALAQVAADGMNSLNLSWMDAFLGFIRGSIGETSALASFFGAGLLIITGIASWRIVLSVCVGTIFMSGVFNLIGSETNPMFNMPFWWHMVLGGWAFGTAFMATDPVSGAVTNIGKYFYGLLIGIMVVLIRVLNPAFAEGMMLAILFSNAFAPVIDYYVIRSNIKRRKVRTRLYHVGNS